MLRFVQGDLLRSDCTIIGQQCNCFSVMGAGFARQIKKMYPGAYLADKTFPFSPQERLGKFSYFICPNRAVFNLYGQYRYGRDIKYTDYQALRSSLQSMFRFISTNRDSIFRGWLIKIGFPYGMGCGLAGGNWPSVSHMLDILSDQFKMTVFIYKLN